MNSPWEDLVMTVQRQTKEIRDLQREIENLKRLNRISDQIDNALHYDDEKVHVSGVPYAVDRGDMTG